MEKTVYVLLFVVAVSILSNGVEVNAAKARDAISEIDRKLKLLNKPAVKSIESEDGDIIDCVDIYKQPAFDHPALKNHTIRLMPSIHIPTEKEDRRNESSRLPVTTQTWQKSGSCPRGTVPIRRTRREDLLRAASIEQFGRKIPEISYGAKHRKSVTVNNKTVNLDPQVNRSSAVLYTLGNYIGAQANINIWDPNVESTEDYTTAQIWLKVGPGDNFESIESGWMVNPKLFADTLPRLFTYWTSDASKSTGCFDLTCSGFVHTNYQIAIGGSLLHWSSLMGSQYILPIDISKDPEGNWWLKWVNYVIGYWPGELFSNLKNGAASVEWGGEVYSPKVKKTPHTKTAMGSGYSAGSQYGAACYMDQLRIIDGDSLELKYPESVNILADECDFYDAYNYMKEEGDEPAFYFGGPGQSPHCR